MSTSSISSRSASIAVAISSDGRATGMTTSSWSAPPSTSASSITMVDRYPTKRVSRSCTMAARRPGTLPSGTSSTRTTSNSRCTAATCAMERWKRRTGKCSSSIWNCSIGSVTGPPHTTRSSFRRAPRRPNDRTCRRRLPIRARGRVGPVVPTRGTPSPRSLTSSRTRCADTSIRTENGERACRIALAASSDTSSAIRGPSSVDGGRALTAKARASAAAPRSGWNSRTTSTDCTSHSYRDSRLVQALELADLRTRNLGQAQRRPAEVDLLISLRWCGPSTPANFRTPGCSPCSAA